MTPQPPSEDLFVLVADLDIQNAVGALLTRTSDLDIGRVSFRIERHSRHDNGCRHFAVPYLRTHCRQYRRALVVFDRYGSGSDQAREQIQNKMETDLARNGWPNGRAKVIVIEPELEAWLWAGSSEVSRLLGWGSNYRKMRRWLEASGHWVPGRPKPTAPKAAMRAALRRGRARWTSPLFAELARRVDFSRCRDSAFIELRDTLRTWFPPPSGSTPRNR